MSTSRSRIILGTTCDVERMPPVLHAYGAPDDHHRLTVLLAARVEQVVGKASDQTRACQAPQTPWSERVGALRRALETGMQKAHEPYPFAIADLDALAPSERAGWDERSIFKERDDFYQVLLRAIDRTGWLVFRPSPSPVVTEGLDALDADQTIAEPPAPRGLPPELLDVVPLDCRPVAAWLHQTGRLSAEGLDDVVEQAKDVGEHLLRLAYDALPRRARDTGELLSAVRRPQHLNGALGQFAFGDAEPSAASLPRASVDALRAAGFLQPGIGDAAELRLPRPIRGLLAAQARLSLAERVTEVHARLAHEPAPPGASAELLLEVPFHALRSGDLERAKATARFSADLRDHGARLSREGEWGAAAELFQYLVERFDAQDAYAHEYLGYNLARNPETQTKERPRILAAYEAAHRLAKEKNPLYYGRLLGFRGEVGEDIAAEFDRAMRLYTTQYPHAVSYFAKPVLEGLARGQRHELRARLVARWGTPLKRLAPRALEAP